MEKYTNGHSATQSFEPTTDGFISDHTGTYEYEVIAGQITGRSREVGRQALASTDEAEQGDGPRGSVSMQETSVQRQRI